ncbi:MAG: class I SAM-dependent methyltransferase [Thermoguttaceae bacterium]|jgi:ubiquinone/menaquinone biosynthesis C-methylase UbiE|nr:class I SAM-dependent methyltransferase [Thermoguttaceae bacterium]
MSPATGRWLEVGVGTGRFAAALGVTDGIDPCDSMLAMAAQRGVRTVKAVAESLPYADRRFDGVLVTTALCFLAVPEDALKECHRVLKPTGRLVVGLIPADSPWGRLYSQKAAQGHSIYSTATFYEPVETIALAERAGFDFRNAYSCLLAPPETFDGAAQPRKGIAPDAGFVAMRFTKRLSGD